MEYKMSGYPKRASNYSDALQQRIKRKRWVDIDEYVPWFHDWEIGTRIVALQDAEFSWGWEVHAGDTFTIRDNISLWQLDFQSVNYCFKEVGSETDPQVARALNI